MKRSVGSCLARSGISLLSLAIAAVMPANSADAQGINLADCKGLWFSTEEDFLSRGTQLPGGQVVSDGDLLAYRIGSGSDLCARNADLLRNFDINGFDLGLDALDQVQIDPTTIIAAFSTELDSVNGAGQFTAGDLLFTPGWVIPNEALLAKFGLPRALNLGLDAVSIEGAPDEKRKLIDIISQTPADRFRQAPDLLVQILTDTNTDILFSTEGTPPDVQKPQFLDGDLLSAKTGTIARSNADLLAALPAGLPDRGVDYGLDAYTPAQDPIENRPIELLSIEIQARGKTVSDGDALIVGPGIFLRNHDLIASFEPLDRDMGLDALAAPIGPVVDRCLLRITAISHVDVASRIDPATGLFDQNGNGTEDYAFGGAIRVQGEVPGRTCPEYLTHEFQVRVSLNGAPEQAIVHPASLDWMGLEAPCAGLATPYNSDPTGWFSLTQYQKVIDCPNDESLAVWRSTADVPGDVADAVLRISMRPLGGGPEVYSNAVHIRVDNKKPDSLEMTLYRAGDTTPIADQCQIDGGGGPVDLDIRGNFHDDHFRTYTMSWTTNGNLGGAIPVTMGRDYDSRPPDLTPTGTNPTAPATDVILETFSLPVLIECGYTISMTVYDRTRVGSMNWKDNLFSASDTGNWTPYHQSFCLHP